MIRSSISQLSNKVKNKRKNKRKMNWLCISGKASNLNRLSRTRSTSPSAQFSIRAILSRVYVQLDARPIEKSCREIVYSWKSSELESAEQCEGKSIKSHPRPNSVFAQFSVVCMFNWMLGQLRKGCREIVCSWKSSELESAEQCTPHPSAQFSVRVILSRVYVQLDARPIEEGLWEGRFLKEGRRFMEELRT